MTELIEFLTSKEIIMVYIVAFIACALYFVIYLIDKRYYKIKRRQNTRELNKLVEDINYELAKERQEETKASEYKEDSSEVFYLEPVIKSNEVISDATMEPSNVVEVEKEEVVEEINKVEAKKVTDEFTIEEAKFEEAENQEIEKEEKAVEEVLDYTTSEPDQTEAQEELRRLTEALEQAEETTRNIDLTSYEEMQEKEAIISLEELLKRGKEMYENNELTQYADEGNEPISLEDLEKRVLSSLEKEEFIEAHTVAEQEPVIEQVITAESLEVAEPKIINSAPPEKFVMDDFYTITSEEARKSTTAYTQYQSQPIISPVYGIEKTKSDTDIELENTANYEKLDEEIKKTNEFLMTLKELQKNLE